MNCDNCRWFNKTGFVPGFGDCTLNREVHSAKHEACEHYERCDPRPHGELTTESAIDYLTNIGWLPEHDRILTERPHGEWETYKDSAYSGGGYLMCTKCQYRFSFGAYRILQDDNYCPHCGVKIWKECDPE